MWVRLPQIDMAPLDKRLDASYIKGRRVAGYGSARTQKRRCHVKRIPESRIRQLVKHYEEMLVDLQDEYDDETDVESTDSYQSDSEAGRTGGPLSQAPLPFPPEEGKIPIPPSLVVVDEAKKAKR